MDIRSKRILWVMFGAVVIAAAALFHHVAQRALRAQLLIDARAANAAGEFSEAERLARRVIAGGGSTGESRLVAAEAAMRLGANDRALAYLEPLLVDKGMDAGEVAKTALGAATTIYWEQGDLVRSEKLLRDLLRLDPNNRYATSRLAYLLTLTGRHWESAALRLSLMRMDSFEFDDLLLWGNARALVQSDELPRLRQIAPDDPLVMLGSACVAARGNNLALARELLPQIVAVRPDLVEAHVLRGYLLLEQPTPTEQEIVQWNKQLPVGGEEHPDIWMIRGLWTVRSGASEAAGRCFWEVVRRSPNHHTGNYQLAMVLKQLGSADAEWFRQRAEWLEELQRLLGILDTQREDVATMRRVVELDDKLGRPWEVWGWSRIALLLDSNLKWAQQSRGRAEEQIKSSPPQVLPESSPESRFHYDRWPLPAWLGT